MEDQKVWKIFVINPGSTSTKLSLFENEKLVWEKKVFHDASVLVKFKCINDQLEYRFEMIKQLLADDKIDLSNVAAIVGRGGSSYTVESGVYEINNQLILDTVQMKGGLEHASMLGTQLAKKFHDIYGGKMLMLDPIVVDEYSDLARMTGIKGLYRTPSTHTLNQKGVAMKYAKRIGKQYKSLNLVVCHIDGGITIAAHTNGRMVDCNSGAGGDGPYTPSRIGSIGIVEFIHYCKGKDMDELEHMCNTGGGFSSLIGTNDADIVHEMVVNNDSDAIRAWDGMVYQICKCIGAMAAVLEGKVDAILLTGGLMRFDDIIQSIEKRCGWIAPIEVFPGEVEQEAMAAGAMRVLRGEETVKQYKGSPVFKGF